VKKTPHSHFRQPREIHFIYPKTAALGFNFAAIGTVFFGYTLFLEEKFWFTLVVLPLQSQTRQHTQFIKLEAQLEKMTRKFL